MAPPVVRRWFPAPSGGYGSAQGQGTEATLSRSDIAWKAVALGVGAASAFVTRKAITAVWKGVKGDDPPSNPAARSTTWSQALVWAVASGVALAVARLVAQRSAAAAWKAKTGGYPRALEEAS
jgi:Protein of unknown function (DUF4235)